MSKSQDDPCKFIHPKSHSDTSLVAGAALSNNHKKSWKHSYKDDWQILCFTPDQLKESMPSIISCQLNSNINESFRRKIKSALLEIAISDETQLLWIPDSLFKLNRDLSRVKIGISKQGINRLISPMLDFTLETQKFNAFETAQDSMGLMQKSLESGFLSPGKLILQSGIKLSFKPGNQLDLGIASAKYDWISNKNLRIKAGQSQDVALVEESTSKISGGFSAIGNFESAINKILILEQSCRLFYPISKPRGAELEMRNKLSLKLSKNLKTSLLTTFSYAEDRWPPSFWRAEFRLGYFIEN